MHTVNSPSASRRLAAALLPAIAMALLCPLPALAAGTLAVAQPVAQPPAQPLSGKTIVVDAGHGGRDTGALGNGLREKDLTLGISQALQGQLQSRGARVVMTRTGDVALGPNTDADLQARVDMARAAHANAFVSVHVNQVKDPAYGGASTYYGSACGFYSGASQTAGDVGRSFSLARRIQASLVAQTGEADRGTRNQIFWVLGDPGIPSALVETGFLSNKDEAAKLANPAYQAQIAHAIADGLSDFFASGDANRDPAAPAAALAPCAPPQPAAVWLQTFLPARLLSGPDPKALVFTVLPPFSYLKLLGQAGSYLYVVNPQTNGPGYVEGSRVGPSGPPPAFEPFWVENFVRTGIWSAVEGGVRFGTAPQWSRFLVVAPQEGDRLFVRVAATGNVAYVNARDVGPVAPPS